MRRLQVWPLMMGLVVPSVLFAQALPFGVSLPPSLNFATSPSPVGSGARAAGIGFAFIAVADDATAASHNPGGLVQLERPEVSIVGSYLRSQGTQDVTRPQTVVEDQAFDSFNLNYLSAVYPFQLWQRNVVVSLNVQRLFDLQGDTDVASRFLTIEGIQRVSAQQDGALYTLSPAVAVQLTPTFSVGAAFNIWSNVLLDDGWEQSVSVQGEGRVVMGNRIVPFVSTGRIKEDYTFDGFNVTAGFLWRMTPVFSLGGVFRSPFTADITHRHNSTLTVTFLDGPSPSIRHHQQRFSGIPRDGSADVVRARPLGSSVRPLDAVARCVTHPLVPAAAGGIPTGRCAAGREWGAVRQRAGGVEWPG